jgi:hypothetical protein
MSTPQWNNLSNTDRETPILLWRQLGIFIQVVMAITNALPVVLVRNCRKYQLQIKTMP